LVSLPPPRLLGMTASDGRTTMTTTKVLALLVAGSAVALLSPATARGDSACVPDAQRFCTGVPFGEGRVMTCLQSRWSDLSSACQQEIQTIQNRANQINSACATDVWQYCPRVRPGGGRLLICLRSHWDDLSSTCRDGAARLAEKATKLQQGCSADIERLCPGIEPGGGQIFLCLKAQESKTSSQCQAALR
jgi:hypothetical protein